MQGMARMSFVSRSVISSSDGFEFKEEQTAVPDNEEVHPDLRKLDGRSLYEQLKERQDEADAERQSRQKLNFAPPRALDEEDVAFYERLEEEQASARRQAQEQEELDRATFEAARADRVIVRPPTQGLGEAGGAAAAFASAPAAADEPFGAPVRGGAAAAVAASAAVLVVAPPVVIKRRRKDDVTQADAPIRKHGKEAPGAVEESTKRSRASAGGGAGPPKVAVTHQDAGDKLAQKQDAPGSQKLKSGGAQAESATRTLGALGALAAYGSDSDSA